jgi:hypothetical protein
LHPDARRDFMRYRYPAIIGVVTGLGLLLLTTLTVGLTSITHKLCGPDPCPPNPEYGYGLGFDIQAGDVATAILAGLIAFLVAVTLMRAPRGSSEGASG